MPPTVAATDSGQDLAKAQKILLESGDWSDLTIKCRDRTWRVHRNIVCARCDFFKAACSGSFSEATSKIITLDDDPPTGVELMLEYIYTMKVPVICTFDSAKEMYMLGDKYNLPPLRTAGFTTLCTVIKSTCIVYSVKGKLDRMIAMVEDIWSASEVDQLSHGAFKSAALEGLRVPARSLLDEVDFQSLIWRNKSFGLAFMKEMMGTSRTK